MPRPQLQKTLFPNRIQSREDLITLTFGWNYEPVRVRCIALVPSATYIMYTPLYTCLQLDPSKKQHPT